MSSGLLLLGCSAHIGCLELDVTLAADMLDLLCHAWNVVLDCSVRLVVFEGLVVVGSRV